ncbi:zinc finger protein 479-like isoform X2 [Toxorhynchites rutilus septentrionalis]|uniref:zinc finger protein 479-like isoform X2 n=1 Tax=Toxorhynchites rutilus septentrionalis TaxID=329112 RepID=UPI00247A7D3B|nr:zinc finger protein 479-like isoform X2 [Toxorhynchites rutilus septentrionalis]
MPYYCAVKGCGNNMFITKGNPDIAYHTFPRNPDRLRRWIVFCGHSETWKPQKNQGICTRHFDRSCYDELYEKRRQLIGARRLRMLLPDAIPTKQVTNTMTETTVSCPDKRNINNKAPPGPSICTPIADQVPPFQKPYRCAVEGCYNNRWRTRERLDLTYHHFPKDGDRLREWVNYCRRDDGWERNQNDGICSIHFDPSCYEESDKIRKVLRPLAVPGVAYELSSDPHWFAPKDSMIPRQKADDQNNSVQYMNEECLEEDMIVERLDEAFDETVTELKIEPRSPSSVPEDTDDVKKEIEEEAVELPLPQIEVLADSLDIPSEDQLLNQFCRLCLREIPNLFPLMSRIQNVLVPEMYKAVTGLELGFAAKLSKKVCINCLIRLDYAYNIRKEFLEANRTLKCFSLSRIISLVENLQNYQKAIRVTTESYGEKVLRQHRDIIRMRLIKKQEHLEKMVGDEGIEVLKNNTLVGKYTSRSARDQPDLPSDVEVASEADSRLEQSVELVEILDEESLEDRTAEDITFEHIIDGAYVEEQESTPQHPIQYVTKRNSRKGNRYHIELRETKPDPNKCYICEKVFENTEALELHKPSHVGMIPYTCERCVEEGGREKEITSLILLHRHFRMHAGSIKCPKCPMRTFTSTALYGHIASYHRADSTTKYTCEICGHQMVNIKRFHIHMGFHRAVEQGRYKCNQCDKKFGTKARLERHERIHTQSFTNETTLHIHERTHTGEKGFRCDICGECFQSTKNLIYHIEEAHDGPSGEQGSAECYEIKCAVKGCNYRTKNRYKYYNHKARHALRFHCSYCTKQFGTKQQLQHHETGHTGVKPYCCEQCGKGFRYRHCLIDHVNVHNNIRPYSCEICGLSFVRERNLREHRLKHSDKLSYKCRFCGKKFKYRADQSRHERIHRETPADQPDIGNIDEQDAMMTVMEIDMGADE